ncbi:hypothetical protein CROQUDRAFT_376206 [Cronartium quercuum f. sp. fusiforme G11]|uniref:Uncharacterized protein n=1 Tax=Cronartium quercuum f. sp. fusiforme G11 TaxID=708437 RepID=A0A9P6T791_9BASI|nr:hypothetical protein CROQUDRAFT_376206 [Cronartium quercuum f. sp. fusiforme G11]
MYTFAILYSVKLILYHHFCVYKFIPALNILVQSFFLLFLFSFFSKKKKIQKQKQGEKATKTSPGLDRKLNKY